MMVLHMVSYAAALVAFLFVTLSLASGLLYVAEVIEENSQSAKKYGRQAIYCIIGAHILFCVFDHLPLKHTLLGIFCHMVYLSNFSRSWPFVSLLSPSFIASCCLVVVDHFTWFFYFADRASHPKHRQPYRPSWDDGKPSYPTDLSFMDVATFFALCVWFVPFFLFLSLSANDNVLPSLTADHTPMIAQQPPTPTEPGGLSGSQSLPANLSSLAYNGRPSTASLPTMRGSILRNILEGFLSMFPNLRRSPYKSGRTGSRPNEGIIASPSLSTPSSPVPSNAAQWGTPSQSHYPNGMAQGSASPPPPSPGPASLRTRPTTPRRNMTMPPQITGAHALTSQGTSQTSPSKALSLTRRPSPAARALTFGTGSGGEDEWPALGQAFNPDSPPPPDGWGDGSSLGLEGMRSRGKEHSQ